MPRSRGLLVLCALLFLSHIPYLNLPYFWDELGQFVPAALDIREHGAWIPRSTLPNVHPPGVMAYLAGVWSIAGTGIAVTRLAMLALAALGVAGTWLLARQLGSDGVTACLLLIASPVFYMQAIMAQLDMPAMSLGILSLWLFLRDRTGWCVAVSTLLVLAKETGLLLPFVFGVTLLIERRIREALLFFIPLLALGGWLLYLRSGTGHLLGNQEFAHYNVAFQLHPVRLSLTIVRRFYYLFIGDFHWMATAVLIWAWRRGWRLRSRAWRVTLLFCLGHLLAVSILGGAALERYVVPVLPVLYIAVASALLLLSPRLRLAMQAALLAGLTAALFINPPFPFPLENNLAMVDFVRLQERAARLIQASYPERTAVSAWPFPDALKRPEFGYVDRPLRSAGIENFNAGVVLARRDADLLVIYSRTWEPEWGVLRSDWVRSLLSRYYFYEPQVTREQIEQTLRLRRVARFDRGGQWIEVYAR